MSGNQSKRDPALEILLTEIRARQTSMLWCCDEQWDGSAVAASKEPLQAITHRCDTADALRERGVSVLVSDYAFDSLDFTFEAVAYRISKEKALVHHLIKQSLQRLPMGGELLLSGFKNEGFKTYVDKARVLVGSPKQISKGRGGAMLARITKHEEPSAAELSALKDDDYANCRSLSVNGLEFVSKPGVYGWQKVDKGSALLMDVIEREDASSPRHVLDLGCGYGYLTIRGHRLWPESQWKATDNNAAAIKACAANLEQFGIAGEAVLADCAEGIDESFDRVLCNPPFHRGFDHDASLTRDFTRAAAERLADGGSAWFVVNQFIALPAVAADYFASVELVEEADGYRVYRLSR